MRSLRVLLVEDSPPDSELVLALLEDSGATVEICSSLREALDILGGRTFDVAVADLSLPDALDLEAVSVLRAAAPGLPLVVLTGRDDEQTALQALAAGAQDYVAKRDLTATVLIRSLRYAQERAHADEALRVFSRWTAVLLDGLEAATCAVDERGTVLAVNAALRGGEGSSLLPAAVGGSLTAAWQGPGASRSSAALLAGLEDVLSGRIARFEHECETADGRCWSVRTTPLPGVGAVVTQVDVTAMKAAQHQLTAAALHDPLTGLPNRALLRDRLSQSMETARRHGLVVAVVFLDLDRFKQVNDNLGHATGDAVLLAVAERLAACARASDTVARVSGDEYIVVCVADGQEQATALAQRLVDEINNDLVVDGRRLSVTASAGLAIAQPGDALDDVVQVADEAMYAAKAKGGATLVVASEEMRGLLSRRLHAEQSLRRALAEERVEVHYQPVVRLTDGSVCGAEALVRLRDPSGRLVPPAEFIEVAERTGLIVPLGALVLRTACAEAARWTGELAALSIAVNLSTRQLAQPDIVPAVQASLAAAGLAPDRLVLEVTESAVVEDAEAALRALSALKQIGVRTAIDDFGTGYSSFLYLKQFPVGLLKIDRSFVGGMLENPDDAAIVASIVRLGRDIGVTVLAEGVETEEQNRHLSELGCDQAQGYLFSRPVPASELAAAAAAAVRAVPASGLAAAAAAAVRGIPSQPKRVQRRIVPPLQEEAAARIAALSQAGASLHTIAAALNSDGVPSPSGRRWHAQSVARHTQPALRASVG
jgi:diguanylate cyclase (GGDEF)-like protein